MNRERVRGRRIDSADPRRGSRKVFFNIRFPNFARGRGGGGSWGCVVLCCVVYASVKRLLKGPTPAHDTGTRHRHQKSIELITNHSIIVQ